MNGSLDIRISKRDAVAFIQAFNLGDNTLVNTLTDKLAASVAARFAERVYSRAYWVKYERAKRLIIHFVWPFERKEVA